MNFIAEVLNVLKNEVNKGKAVRAAGRLVAGTGFIPLYLSFKA